MGLEMKKGDQIIFLVDRSGSMATADCEGGATRYEYVRETVKTFVQAASQFDPDGVSVHLFNNRVELHPNVADVQVLNRLIDTHKPGGSTDTAKAIEAAWLEHAACPPGTSTFVMIFTDGEPDDQEAVKREIVGITKKMKTPEEFRLSFLTVGERSSALTQFLEDLDSNLKGAAFDIVGVEEAAGIDFQSAIADLIGSSTTAGEAAAGNTAGKATTHV